MFANTGLREKLVQGRAKEPHIWYSKKKLKDEKNVLGGSARCDRREDDEDRRT